MFAFSFTSTADYLLSVNDGSNQTNYCISSFSTSNNLESISTSNLFSAAEKEVYSTTETLTNKTWKGFPVYRKIVELGDLSGFGNTSNIWHQVPLETPEISELINANVRLNGTHQQYTHYSNYGSQMRYGVNKKEFNFTFTPAYSPNFKEVTIVIEYTKLEDANSQDRYPTIINYIHFVESGNSSTNVKTLITNGKAINIHPGFEYDSATNACSQKDTALPY